MTIIPKSMRLPFTFGLSGALHAAVLSNLMVPPPVGYPSAPIQVRLVKHASRGDTGAHLLDISNNPIARAASFLPTEGRDAALTQRPRVQAAISPKEQKAEAKPRLDAEANPAVGVSSELDSGLKIAETAALVIPAMATKADPNEVSVESGAVDGAVNKSQVEIGAVNDVPGEIKKAISAEPDGTIASPFSVPRALYSPLRKYPEEARWERRTGQGSLAFRLKPDGSVGEEIRILRSSGHADLDATAVESLRHWRFALPPNASPSLWYRYPFRFGMS